MTNTGKGPGIFGQFDDIRIINLRSRTDRRAQMLAEIRRLRIDEHPSLAFFDAIARTDRGPFLKTGSHGAFDSYTTLLEEAAQSGRSILILQDDCRFLKSVDDPVDLSDVDTFYGGWTAIDKGPVEQSGIVGAHCMGFSAKAAALCHSYLRDYKSPSFAVDPIALAEPGFDPAIRPPIDGALVWFRRAHPALRTRFHKISTQRSSPSSISPRSSLSIRLSSLAKRLIRV